MLDAKTFYIPNLHYDGAGPDAYFWVGNGSEPSPFGTKVSFGIFVTMFLCNGLQVLKSDNLDHSILNDSWSTSNNFNNKKK